jgi:hypothetical protein
MTTTACKQLMIDSLSFASCYQYAPGGACEVSERSRFLCALLKAGDKRVIVKYAEQVRHRARDTLADFLGPGAVLIPVPSCAIVESGSASVARLLADAFVDVGLARAQWDCLRRVRAVRKSAAAPAGERPTTEGQYASLCVEYVRPMYDCSRLTLIDDVVTRGRTLLAAATRLKESFPDAQIQAFALVRTRGFAARLERLFDPCIGEICWRRGDARRNP